MWLAIGRIAMSAQFSGADVLHLAAAAFVGPLVGVHTFVQLEGRLPAELLLTNVASKRLTGVDSHMRLQIGVVIETLVAKLAFKRLFPRMNQHVLIEVLHLNVPLIADFAFNRSFARVRTRMDLEMGQKWGARLCTDVAPKVLLSVYPLYCVR